MALGTKRKAANTLSKQPLDLPPATVHAFAGTTAPEGWAMCDGSEVSRTEYAALFAAVGTTYGVGDGLDTFNLPDMRGQFLRALDDMGTAQGAAGVDVDGTARTVGQPQAQATRKNGLTATQASHRHLEGNVGVGSIDNNYNRYGRVGGQTTKNRPSGSSSTSTGATYTQTVTPAITIADGDTETRPINMAVNYIIKL